MNTQRERSSYRKRLSFEHLESRIALTAADEFGVTSLQIGSNTVPVHIFADDASGSTNAAAAVPESLLTRRIVTWATLGPFTPTSGDAFNENFLATNYTEADAYAYLGATVNGKTWEYFDDRTISRNLDDYVDFYTFYDLQKGLETSNRVAYAAVWLYVPASGTYRVHFGHNDKAKLWVDGNLIVSESTPQLAQREDHQVNVNLAQGWRRVLVKVVNVQRTWGFYFSLTHTDNSKIANLEIAPHDPGPTDPLTILTPNLPDGYGTQPYIWLYVTNPLNQFPEDNASASPFRFVGRGGIAPYTYHLHNGSLPAGMSLNSTEGELLGIPTSYGIHTFTIRMQDSSGATAAIKTFTLDIKPRPTTWLEQGNRMGGLRHGLQKFDNPVQQAQLAARQGYDWIAPTDFSWVINANRDIIITSDPSVDTWAAAMHAHGVEVGIYQGLGDPWYGTSGAPPLNALEYTEGFHDALEQWARRLDPKIWWFDGRYSTVAYRRRPPNLPTYEFDALFSLLKALNPDALILVNSGEHDGQLAEVGDVDFASFEGKNDVGNYWLDWPATNLFVGTSPKYLMLDSWRYPDATYNDWQEWLRVIITMLAEPENNSAARVVDFDTSWTLGDQFYNLHLNIANWLDPFGGGERRKAIMGTFPYSINEGSWGYDVFNPDTGDVYLHFIANPRGKNGVFGSSITVGPVDFTVRQVSLLPNDTPMQFTQIGNMVTINMSGVTPDPISTIVELSATPPLVGDYNLDDHVDAADYVMWRKTFGTAVARFSGADGSGSSLVDEADYGVWHNQFAMALPSGASPATIASPVEALESSSVISKTFIGQADSLSATAEAAAFASLASGPVDLPHKSRSGYLRRPLMNRQASNEDSTWLLDGAKPAKPCDFCTHLNDAIKASDESDSNSDPRLFDELLDQRWAFWEQLVD